jgi:hypothetical protein
MTGEATKVCSKCKVELPLSSFFKEKKGRLGRRPACKKCEPKRYGPGAHRSSYLKRKYDITIEDYQKLIGLQNKKCAICNQEKSLVVDHSHTTGVVRGLLCNHCNLALGMFDDSVKNLLQAYLYLAGAEGV